MAESSLLDRSIPARIADKIQMLEKCGLSSLYVGQLEKAIKCYNEMLQMLLEAQIQEDRPIHKGVPYHMLGLAHLYAERIDEAFWNVLLAYIEDTLNVGHGLEQEADSAPAGRLLVQFFQIDAGHLSSIKDYVVKIKISRLWGRARDPVEVLRETSPKSAVKDDFRNWYNFAMALAKTAVLARKKDLGFKWIKRVFIGGNYYGNMETLRKIADIVKAKKFIPVIVNDYRIPDEGLINHHSLMLLHTCRLAIFELSVAGGQYFEIARVNEYDIPTLGLYRQDSPYWKSSMLVTMSGRIAFKSYGSDAELKDRTEYFLDNPPP